jgi:hypothetical protein
MAVCIEIIQTAEVIVDYKFYAWSVHKQFSAGPCNLLAILKVLDYNCSV